MTEFLARSGTVVLNGAGSGTVRFAPSVYRETWTITKFTTDGNSATEVNLDIKRNGSEIIDSTPHGNSDVSETNTTLHDGEYITAEYTGGTAGGIMRFYLEGTIARGV